MDMALLLFLFKWSFCLLHFTRSRRLKVFVVGLILKFRKGTATLGGIIISFLIMTQPADLVVLSEVRCRRLAAYFSSPVPLMIMAARLEYTTKRELQQQQPKRPTRSRTKIWHHPK